MNTSSASGGGWIMKRIITLIMIFVIVLSSLAALTPIRVQAADGGTVIFQDDFESYSAGAFPSAGGWQIVWGGSSALITNSYSHSPTNSFQLIGRYGWSCVVKRDFSSNSSVIGYEACLMTESTSANGGVGFFNQYIATWGRFYAGVGYSGGNIVSGPQILMPISPYTWYKVDVLLDKNTRNYNVWINDSLVAWNLTEPNDPYEILSLQVSTGWDTTPNYFDDTKIISSLPPQPLTVSITPTNATTSIGGATTYNIKVRNNADAPDNVTLNLAGLNPLWYSLSRDRLTMVAGETSTVQLQINIPENPGITGSYPFQVTANDSSTQKSASGNLTVLLSPIMNNVEPENNTTIGASDIYISWTTSALASSEVYIKTVEESTFNHFVGEEGTSHLIHILNLTRNQDYCWYARSATPYANVSSETRMLHVGNGITFSQSVYVFNAERDYAQRASVSVTNNDTQPHDLLLQALNPYEDLIVGFVGPGSVDENVTLASGETRTVDFNIFAQDATQQTYTLEFKLTNLGQEPIRDYAHVIVNVRQPNINLQVAQTGTDNSTLSQTYTVTNHGDTVTDLRVAPDDALKSQLQIQPTINHALLRSGESLQFTATPLLSSNFTALQGSIHVEAANTTEEVPFNVSLPDGQQVFTVDREDVTWTTCFNDWYCTNRPRIDEFFSIPSWIQKTYMGEPNVDTAALIVNFVLVWPLEDYRQHNVHFLMNGIEFGNLENTVPSSYFIFPLVSLSSGGLQFDSYLLNYASEGLAQNVLTLQMDNLNGGHYVVSTNMKLVLHIRHVEVSVVAPDNETANLIVDQMLGTTLSNYLDLGICAEGITVSDPHPQLGENVTVSARVLNFGTLNALDAPISLYVDSTEVDTLAIPDVPPFSTQIINFTWVASAGSHNITISINENRTLSESNYENNKASTQIFVATPTVTFAETGLPPSTLWNVNFDGANHSSTNPTIQFPASNGTHSFVIDPVANYISTPASGNIIVNGSDIKISVSFTPIPAPAGGLIFEDEFAQDTCLNTALWRVNAPLLYDISAYESSAFNEEVSVSYPNLPLAFSGQGMNWGMTGYNTMSAVTSNIVFTPPYLVTIDASASLSSGNPIAVFLTNKEPSSFIALFVSNSMWVQVGKNNPVDIYDHVSLGKIYSFQISVTVSSLQISVLDGVQLLVTYSQQLGVTSDYGYLLTLGSFAGQIPGEQHSNPCSVAACYSYVAVTSSSTWNLTVTVEDDKFHPMQNVNVVVTNLFRNSNLTQNTNAEGTTLFTKIISGFYTVSAWASQADNVITEHFPLQIADTSAPQLIDMHVTIILSIPLPDALSVRISLSDEAKLEGLAPINDTFHADAFGWVGNYTYAWYVNNTVQQFGSNSDFREVFDSAGSYTVKVTASSSGTWYGQPEETRSATSGSLTIHVSNSPYLAFLDTSGDNVATLSHNGIPNQAVFYIEDGRVLIEANATDNAFDVISVPEWLSTWLGVENALRGISLGAVVDGNEAAVDTGMIIEPGSTASLNNASLPLGVPTGLQALQGYKFKVILDPMAKWALAGDAVTVVFGMLGAVTTLKSMAPSISGSDMAWIISQMVQLLAEGGARLAIDISSNTRDISSALGSAAGKLMNSLCSALLEAIPEALQRILLRYLGSNLVSRICTALVSQVLHFGVKLASGLETLYLTAQFLVDAAVLLSTILKGQVGQEYTITDINAMDAVTVTGYSPAPYVTVQKGTDIYGYNGGWVSSTSAFVCSDFTPEKYSFAFEDPDNVQLMVQVPPGQDLSEYSIRLYHNGLEETISGVVASGNPQQFVVNYESDRIDVSPTGDTNASISITPEPLNLKCKGQPLNCTVEFQNGLNVNDINASSIMINNTVFADLSAPTLIGDNNQNSLLDLLVHFNRTLIADFILSNGVRLGSTTLTVTGKLVNGTSFIGSAVVAVRMAGDINIDGRVNMEDIGIVAKAFGCCPGDTRWNRTADENEDGTINMVDIALVARQFGKCYT
jgi:hypothetical protein